MSTLYVATTGNDGAAGTLAAPFRTMSFGAARVGPGDTLLVRGGNYNETLNNPALAGTSWSSPVRVACYPSETVWLSPTGNPATYSLYLYGTQQYVEFDGINIDGSGVQFGAVKIEGSNAVTACPHHIRIQNAEILSDVNSTPGPPFKNALLVTAQVSGIVGFNEFLNLAVHRGHAYGFYVNSSDNTIDHCAVYDLNGAAIHMSNSYGTGCDRNTISNNVVHSVLGAQPGFSSFVWGIINGSGSPSDNVYFNNLVYNIGGSVSGDAGIFLLGGTNTQLLNNTVYGGTGEGIVVSQPSVTGTIVKNNIGYGNALGNYRDAGTGTVQSNNLFGVDPLFLNAAAGDFRLHVGSPAIDAGATV